MRKKLSRIYWYSLNCDWFKSHFGCTTKFTFSLTLFFVNPLFDFFQSHICNCSGLKIRSSLNRLYFFRQVKNTSTSIIFKIQKNESTIYRHVRYFALRIISWQNLIGRKFITNHQVLNDNKPNFSNKIFSIISFNFRTWPWLNFEKRLEIVISTRKFEVIWFSYQVYFSILLRCITSNLWFAGIRNLESQRGTNLSLKYNLGYPILKRPKQVSLNFTNWGSGWFWQGSGMVLQVPNDHGHIPTPWALSKLVTFLPLLLHFFRSLFQLAVSP